MRAHGIINAALAAGLAGLRHTDTVVVCDAGLPVPSGPTLVDLAVVYGLPGFVDVFAAVRRELTVEKATAAEEVTRGNQPAWEALCELGPVPELVGHEDLKGMVAGSALVVRTGENTPFANVVLRCGVPF